MGSSKSTRKSTHRSSERILSSHPPHPSPITPVYACALQNLYRTKAYNCFYTTLPYSRTHLDEEFCRPGGLRCREVSKPRVWRGERELDMATYSADPRGVMLERKGEAHGMQEVYWEDGRVWPKTWVMERLESEETLYPQFGELKSRKRERQKGKLFPVGFQPFLMRIFSDATVTKAELPAPYCDMSERTFETWFIRNMAAIGIGAKFSHVRLIAMSRQDDKQRWAGTETEEINAKETEMMHNLLPHKALAQMLDSETEENRPKEKSTLELEIEAHLQCIQEAKKARRFASADFTRRERRNDSVVEPKAKNETSFVQKCKDGWRALWVR